MAFLRQCLIELRKQHADENGGCDELPGSSFRCPPGRQEEEDTDAYAARVGSTWQWANAADWSLAAQRR